MNVVLSIKPKWAKKIYAGEKTIEWRKFFPRQHYIGDVIFLYESAPVKMVTGYIRIDSYKWIYSIKDDDIKNGCVPLDDLKKYFGEKTIFGYKIKKAVKFSKCYPIKFFSKSGKAPQSFLYTDITIKTLKRGES